MEMPAMFEVMEMTPTQCRAARALLRWSQIKLAGKADVGRSTVYDYEMSTRPVSRDKIQAMRIALELAGVFFNDGVSLRPRR